MDGMDYCEECEKEHREEVKKLREQLKAKEQECEALKAELGQEQALKETYLACYKTKHEDIEGELFNLRQYKASKQASYKQLQKRCNELELENRKLKAENKDLKDEIRLIHDDCKGCSTCFNALASARIYCVENQKLKQTLTEIKELLLKTPTDSREHCVNAKSVILQKISEVDNGI